GLVDEAALQEFLQAKPAATAYLDTFDQEPYNGPLARLENVLMTGHIGTYAREVRAIMEMEAAGKLIKYFKHHGV
ncbi:MAG: hydroxyacid dehydrogenase, partial [Sphingobacteriales bacterium]